MINKAFEPKWFLILVFFLAGIFLGALATFIWLSVQSGQLIRLHPPKSYKYINPLLLVENPSAEQFSQNKLLKIKLQGLIDQFSQNDNLKDAAIYFRDIEASSWMGINEDGKFSPGKLLKVPIMIAYFKIAETDPTILDDKIEYTGKKSQGEGIYGPSEGLAPGEYAVNDLMERMIVKYDDTAAELLFDHIDKDSLNEVFSDLSIPFKEDKDTEDYISLKSFGIFFRVLYNATYLNQEYSEKALALIDKAVVPTSFGNKIPKDILVADRTGAREIIKNGKKYIEEYDCGIVYYPSHPYLLCIMGRSESLDVLKRFFEEVGIETYQEVSYNIKK